MWTAKGGGEKGEVLEKERHETGEFDSWKLRRPRNILSTQQKCLIEYTSMAPLNYACFISASLINLCIFWIYTVRSIILSLLVELVFVNFYESNCCPLLPKP